MRMMMKVTIPVEKGNEGLKSGLLPQTVMGAIERLKPEAAYFYTENGQRTGIMVFDVKDPSDIPSIAEPFFTNLHAGVDFKPVMNADDLKAGLQKMGK